MANSIDFRYDKEAVEKRVKAYIENTELPLLPDDDSLEMSNIGTAKFINVLCLSGGRLAKTES